MDAYCGKRPERHYKKKIELDARAAVVAVISRALDLGCWDGRDSDRKKLGKRAMASMD